MYKLLGKYPIKAVSKPRMTQRDKWQKRKPVLEYRAYKDELRYSGMKLPDHGYLVVFIIAMPKSWSNKKRVEMNGKPHQQKPDKDNLEKGLLDALMEEDSHVWNGEISKFWGEKDQIIVLTKPIVENGLIFEQI